MAKYPKTMILKEINSEKGNFAVFWRGDSKQPARIEGVSNGWFTYTMIAGPDKGTRFRAKYDEEQEVEVYDEDTLLLAACDV